MARPVSLAVQQARRIIAGEVVLTGGREALVLIDQLKRERKFSYARRALAKLRATVPPNDAKYLKLGQQRALCTYKDNDLPAERRLERALAILKKVDDPDSSAANQETLGLAGAIWKRKWEVTARAQDLERALAYHEAASAKGIVFDQGYNAINAAFVLDLLAREDDRQPSVTSDAAARANARRLQARKYRDEVVRELSAMKKTMGERFFTDWWLPATLAEAHFGIGEYTAASDLLEHARAAPTTVKTEYAEIRKPDDWELEATARQLASLSDAQAADPRVADRMRSDASRVIATLVGSDAPALRGAFMGKVGLALSGGGFRASLFHIGVLARLAELDLLRHVEVISCVSGGSIVGAHYYLKLKKLLSETPDHDVKRGDYVRIVRELAQDFTAGVQRNIRTRLFAEFITNLRMLFHRGFTRTKRAGELYEKEIYSRMNGTGQVSDRREWYMEDLLIKPKGEVGGFHPLYHNWRRSTKVPILVINATTLNTGHAWQFTATWMGEPPGDVESDVDGNYRLRRLYYDQAPEPYKTKERVRLGHAVGASSAVPGIFDPVELALLYDRSANDPDEPLEKGDDVRTKILVRLVDGGVHDNQGTASLTDQDCVVQLVSDASGQMSSIDEPAASPLGVLLRSSSVQGARVRTAEYDDLSARRRAGALRGLLFVHLKQGLGVEHIDWLNCDEPHALYGERADDDAEVQQGPRTAYAVAKKVQRLIANVRTDLDSFSDAEAYALMHSGYKMTSVGASGCGVDQLATPGADEPWEFRRIGEAMYEAPAQSQASQRLRRLLGVASQRALKIWRLDTRLKVLAGLIAVGAVWAIAAFLMAHWQETIPVTLPSYGAIGKTLLFLALAAVGGAGVKRLLAAINYRQTLGQVVSSLLLAAGGFLLARLHLWLFDPLYLRWGAIKHFETPPVAIGTSGGFRSSGETRAVKR